jgi:hypothetical protein
MRSGPGWTPGRSARTCCWVTPVFYHGRV